MVLIELSATNVAAHVLPVCEVDLEVIIWTRAEIDFIHFFASGTYGGHGRIAKLPKSKIPGLTAYLDNASAEIGAVEGSTCVIKIQIEVDERDFFGAQEAGWPPTPLHL